MSAVLNATPQDDAGQSATAPAAKKGKKLLYIIVVLVLAGIGGGAYWYFTQNTAVSAGPHDKAAGHGEGAGNGKAPAVYLALQPSFVVNLEDTETMRYMQVDLEIMSRNPKAIEDAKTHMPRIRNSLLLLFGQQHAFDLSSRQGKEALQAKALAEIQRVLKEETGSPGIEAVYFSSFVIQ
jgi:flagellar FliL protein